MFIIFRHTNMTPSHTFMYLSMTIIYYICECCQTGSHVHNFFINYNQNIRQKSGFETHVNINVNKFADTQNQDIYCRLYYLNMSTFNNTLISVNLLHFMHDRFIRFRNIPPFCKSTRTFIPKRRLAATIYNLKHA